LSLSMQLRPGPRAVLCALVLLCCGWCAPLWAQTGAAAPAGAARQRLALVVGIGNVGARAVLESASRDSQAVAAALRAGGFQVLLRQDVNTAELRAALKEFRDQLRADGIGLIYYTGLAAQVDGRNLLLPSDVTLADGQQPSAVAAMLRAVGLPLQEAADALAGGPEAPRALVVDAAYRHPTLQRLTPPGLARPRLANGTMVLLGHALSALQDAPSVEPLAAPPKDPREAAATRFARVLVEALGTPRISVPEALRAIRLSVVDGSGGNTQPFLAGDTLGRVDLADAARLENPAAVAPAAPAASAAAAVAVVPAPVVTPSAPAVPAAPTAAAAASAASAPERRPSTDGRTAQAPGRGERPVFQARSNSFGHAEGDTFSYQLMDTRKDEVLASYTLAIEEVRADGQLSANGGQWLLDPQGRIQQQRAQDGTQSRYEPAQELWWARPQPGESRPVAFKETQTPPGKSPLLIEWRGTAQVGSLRVMETAAGEFEVLPIKTTGQRTQSTPGGGTFTRTVFYAPKLGVPVAIEIEDNDAGGRPLRRERIELTHAQQARSAN
jgi:Caspase domain